VCVVAIESIEFEIPLAKIFINTDVGKPVVAANAVSQAVCINANLPSQNVKVFGNRYIAGTGILRQIANFGVNCPKPIFGNEGCLADQPRRHGIHGLV